MKSHSYNMASTFKSLLIVITLALQCTSKVQAFTVHVQSPRRIKTSARTPYHDLSSSKVIQVSKTVLQQSSSTVEFSYPSQDECVSLGIRDWPQQTKSKPWTETASEGQVLQRYILQGKGSLVVDGLQSTPFGVGSLVDVTGPASLEWNSEGGDDVILLTPGFEQGGAFLGVVAAMIALTGALVVVS